MPLMSWPRKRSSNMLWLMRGPETEDLNFIRNSWLESYRNNPAMYGISNTVYYRRMHEIINRLVASPNVRCVVACDPGMPGQIFGYGVAETVGDDLYLHWVYTKHPFRNFGLGKAIESELKKYPHTSVKYSIRTKITDNLNNSRNYTYDPFNLWSK